MRTRSKAAVLVALLVAATLAACGDDSSSDGGAYAGTAADNHAAAEKIIRQALAPNPKASSGRVEGKIDIKIKGVERFKGTTQVTANGVYDLSGGASVPDFDVDVGLSLNGDGLGGALVLADSKGYIKLGNTGYKLPDAISQKLVAPAAAADNGLTKTAAMFYINPQDWQRDARLVGDASVGGVTVQHVKAQIRPERLFLDASRLVRLLTTLRVTQAVGLPTALGPKVRAALVRSVKAAKGEVWIGKSDHVLRKAQLAGELVVAERDRQLLGGVTGATLDAVINVTEVGEPQRISAPTQLGSYSALQLSLSALGESVRNQIRGK